MERCQVDGTRLEILDGLRVTTAHGRLVVPEGCKRVVAFVALHPGQVERRRVAGSLWPEVESHRAAGNLRSVIWRLRCCGIEALQADSADVSVAPGVTVDVDRVRDWAGRLVTGRYRSEDLEVDHGAVQALDLLPGWYDNWVIEEREELRIAVLAAIDALSGLLVGVGRGGDAVEAALTAVSADPLRESSQHALIRAHLSEGNRCEADRSFSAYELMLQRELGADPSHELARLVRPVRSPRPATAISIPAPRSGEPPGERPRESLVGARMGSCQRETPTASVPSVPSPDADSRAAS